MEYAELLQQMQAAAALDRATAKRVTWATMVMLAERMHHDELVPLGARLPHELWLRPSSASSRSRGGAH